MTIRYRREGGRPPADRELLTVKDPSFWLWRSRAGAVAGRFEGWLEAATAEELGDLAGAATEAGSITLAVEPDAATETVELDRAQARGPHTAMPAGAWGVLLDRLRRLLVELTRFPVAAVALEVDQAGRAARLTHRGREPLELGLSELDLAASVFAPDGQFMTRWQASDSDGRARIRAEPGWVLDVPINHGVADAGEVIVFVELDLYDGPAPVTVQLTASNAE